MVFPLYRINRMIFHGLVSCCVIYKSGNYERLWAYL